MKILKITDKDKNLNNKLYVEYEKLKMEDGWNEGEKEINYQNLIRISSFTKVSLFNASILDVGCGTGDLSAFLRQRNIGQYTGIDIYEPAIRKAKEKYPSENFLLVDILENILDKNTYDFTFCSGGLTTKLQTDNYHFIEAMLTKMWSLTKVGMAFNILTDEDEEPDEDLFSYNIERIIKILKIIEPNVEIHVEKNSLSFQSHFYVYNKRFS